MSITPKSILNFFSSYGLACVVLILLLILTFFGTLEQTEHGLFEVQNKYFNSLFLVHWLFNVIPIPLPGAYLLSGILMLNLICGAILRAPKSWKRPGMLIAHFGIIYMLVSGFVTFHYSTRGHMTLYPQESSNEYKSFVEWEIAIADINSPGKEYIIPGVDFVELESSDEVTFHHDDLPFDLRLWGFSKNATMRKAGPMESGAVEGVMLQQLPVEAQAERNIAAAYASVDAGDTSRQGVLWGMSEVPFTSGPWVADIAGSKYSIDLRRTTFEVPFTITLDKFNRDLHPGTGMAANFESEVTKREGGVERSINIRMNEPLRHKGYTFFQASWGPENAKPGDRLFSTFEVVKNPADQWPLYSCYVISAGLLIHFLQKLLGYLVQESRRQTA